MPPLTPQKRRGFELVESDIANGKLGEAWFEVDVTETADLRRVSIVIENGNFDSPSTESDREHV